MFLISKCTLNIIYLFHNTQSTTIDIIFLKRDVKLVIIGLDDAGKTTTVACLQGGKNLKFLVYLHTR